MTTSELEQQILCQQIWLKKGQIRTLQGQQTLAIANQDNASFQKSLAQISQLRKEIESVNNHLKELDASV